MLSVSLMLKTQPLTVVAENQCVIHTVKTMECFQVNSGFNDYFDNGLFLAIPF